MKLQQDNSTVVDDLLQEHWKWLLESGEITKNGSACLRYQVGDIVEAYRVAEMEIPDIAPNPYLTKIVLEKRDLSG